MAEVKKLAATVRSGTGKGAARQSRRDGNVPGIIYGDGKEPTPINMNYYYLLKHLKAGRFKQTLFNLKVDGKDDAHVICRNVQRDVVKDILDSLTPREAKVLRMRFGIEMSTDHTLEEVGKQFDVTRERIRQIEAKALRKLKHPSRSDKLRSFIDTL